MKDAAVVPEDLLGRAIRLQVGGLYAIWFREVKRAVRDRGQLVGGVSRPLLWVLVMGIGLNPYFRGEIYGEVRFVVPYTYL
jgi:ABC-2 type transport system permease protein